MKKFSLALFAMAAGLAIMPAALADNLVVAQGAGSNGSGTGNYNITTNGNGTVTLTTGQNGTATKNDYARLAWYSSTATGYPAGLTLGNLGGITASVALTAGTDPPFYLLAFTDAGDPFLNTTTGDQILLIEFQPTALSGPGGNTLAFDPATTEFNLYDNTTKSI